jgi:hypothetical protein
MRNALTPSGAAFNFETHAMLLSSFCKLGKYNVSSAWFIVALQSSDSVAA